MSKINILEFHKLMPETLTKYTKYIKWRMTYNCNYHCEYCIQYRNDCSRRHNDSEAYDKLEVANKIASMIMPNETLVELVGGEISTVKEIPEITKLFHEKGAKIKCLTNLYMDWGFYKYFDTIRASYHPSQCNTEDFKDKILKLRNNGVDISCECVLSNISSKENNDKKYAFWDWCKENNIKITVDNDRFDEDKGSGALKPNPLAHSSYVYLDGVKTEKHSIMDDKGKIQAFNTKCFFGVDSVLIVRDTVWCCDHSRRDFKWYSEPIKCLYGACNMARCFCLHLEKE